MPLAQSVWATAGQTVPIAALTTVALGAVLAPWIARRQEAGKVQAAAEVALRELLIDLRADVVYALARLDAKSSYDPKRFSGRRLTEFTIAAVACARKLPRKRQRKLRSCLIGLVGEWRVRLAEEVGPAMVRKEPDATYGDAHDREAIARDYEMRAVAAVGDGDSGATGGLLGAMATSQLPHEDHPQALAGLDRLLELVGAGPRLGQR